MKRLTFCLLTFIVLTAGCFDGERGMLTELIVTPIPEDTFWPHNPFGETDKVKAGTGSDMVISPVPPEIQDALWGTWDADLEALQDWLDNGDTSVEPSWAEFVPWEYPATHFCQQLDRRQFYDKYLDAGGMAVLSASALTSDTPIRDEFMYVTGQILLLVTSKMPELRQAFSPENGFRYVVTGARGFDVGLPDELRKVAFYGGFYVGGVFGYLAVGGVYNHIYIDAPRGRESINSVTVVHEMAHAIDDAFDKNPHLFPNWGTRLKTAYTLAYQKALKGEGYFDDIRLHAMSNEWEYWAVGAHEWFHDLHGDNVTYERQRAKLIEQDPLLYALLDEVFPAVNLPVYIWIEE